MKKKILSLLLVMVMVLCAAACGNNNAVNNGNNKGNNAASDNKGNQSSDNKNDNNKPSEPQKVELTLWADQAAHAMYEEMIAAFKAAHPEYDLTVTLGDQSAQSLAEKLLADVTAGGDIFEFPADQLNTLVSAGALQEVLLNTDDIIAANGGNDAGAVVAASSNGKLYAYPMTASNGYFLYYNKAYFSDADVASIENILKVCAANNKQFTMDYSSGWYTLSFFVGAGMEVKLAEDNLTTLCNFNTTTGKYTGVDVAQSMLDLAKNKSFVALGDAEFVTQVQEGNVIAGINGTWNAPAVEAAWGENYAATKLPTFTCKGDQVQMSSVAGYKFLGVNSYSDNAGVAMLLAEFLTNYENQVKRFELTGEGPSNVQAAASDKVKAAPAIAALAAQSAYAVLDGCCGSKYWDPMTAFGTVLTNGNPDNTPLQTLLDTAVEGITAKAE